jgi:hypothetical protein
VLFTLKRLWMKSNFTLQIGHIAYSATVYILWCHIFVMRARLREQLKVPFNSCARYIYGLSRYEHFTQYACRMLGIPLLYCNFRMCCTMNNIIKTGCPPYLFSEIQFGESSRMFNIIIHFTDQIECLHRSSFKVQSCGMACHLMTRERGALRSLGKNVRHICVDFVYLGFLRWYKMGYSNM